VTGSRFPFADAVLPRASERRVVAFAYKGIPRGVEVLNRSRLICCGSGSRKGKVRGDVLLQDRFNLISVGRRDLAGRSATVDDSLQKSRSRRDSDCDRRADRSTDQGARRRPRAEDAGRNQLPGCGRGIDGSETSRVGSLVAHFFPDNRRIPTSTTPPIKR